MKRMTPFLVLLLFVFSSCKTVQMATRVKEVPLMQPRQQVEQPLKDPDNNNETGCSVTVRLNLQAEAGSFAVFEN